MFLAWIHLSMRGACFASMMITGVFCTIMIPSFGFRCSFSRLLRSVRDHLWDAVSLVAMYSYTYSHGIVQLSHQDHSSDCSTVSWR